MPNKQPEVIVSPRWPYFMLTVAAALAVAYMALSLVAGRYWDWTFYAMTVPIEITLIGWLISVAPKVLRPPTLQIDDSGVTLRNGLKTRSWPWDQIESFYSQPLPNGGATVALKWQPDGGRVLQSVSLNYPFKVGVQQLLDRLMQALTAARKAGVPAPVVQPRVPDMQAAARWRRCMNLALGALIAAFVAVVVDLNTARTVLVTPLPAALRLGGIYAGGCLGLLIVIAMYRLQQVSTTAMPSRGKQVIGFLFFGVVFATAGGLIFGRAAWRIGDLAAFGTSKPLVVRRFYRIVDFEHTKRGYTADVEPYSATGRTSLPVSIDDFKKLVAADLPYRASRYCYPVLAQQSGTAVRITTPPSVQVHEHRIIQCPIATDDHWRL